MSEITTGQFPEHLLAAVRIMAGEAYKAYPTLLPKMFKIEASTRASEEGVMMTGSGLGVNKAQGAPIAFSGIQQGFLKRFVHATYSKGYAITMEMLEDDQSAVKVSELATRDMVKRMAQTKEIIGANIFNRAFSSSYQNGGDGKALIVSDHPLGGGGTASNVLATAADLSEASLEQMLIDIAGIVDENNIITPVMPKALLIPKELRFEATRLLESMGRVQSSDNDVNAIKYLGAIPELIVNPYLTDTDAFFILTDAENSLMHFERRGLKMDSHNDFMTKNTLVSAIESYSFGWVDWRGVVGTPGA